MPASSWKSWTPRDTVSLCARSETVYGRWAQRGAGGCVWPRCVESGARVRAAAPDVQDGAGGNAAIAGLGGYGLGSGSTGAPMLCVGELVGFVQLAGGVRAVSVGVGVAGRAGVVQLRAAAAERVVGTAAVLVALGADPQAAMLTLADPVWHGERGAGVTVVFGALIGLPAAPG